MFANHPVWLVGFRPFFVAAALAGVLYPLLWGLSYVGIFSVPSQRIAPMAWHAHEMIFGFGWAVLAGFLLTASKNWVKVRGYFGSQLIVLVVLWLLERLTISFGQGLPDIVFWTGANVFVVATVALVVFTLVRHRRTDSFPDNFYFIGALPLFIVSKNLVLGSTTFVDGWMLSLGLFRLAIVVMLERTIVQFMRAHFQIEITSRPAIDRTIKALAAIAVFGGFYPPWLSAGINATLGFLLLIRFLYWRPLASLRRLDVAIMYVAYLGLVTHLALSALQLLGLWSGVGNLSVHALTVGCMGLLIPAMMVRIALGHTGRKIVFDLVHRCALWLAISSALLRVVATQLFVSSYESIIVLSSVAWAACFALLAVRLTPLLLAPRVDGKVH